MRIRDVDRSETPRGATLSATVSFEASSREPLRVEIFAPAGVAARLTSRVDPFVAAAAVVADLHGESTLAVDDPVDARLLHNLAELLSLFRSWWPVDRPALQIEAPIRPVERKAEVPSAAFLMTGGVDSTALLVANHDRYPSEHPLRAREGIVVYGLDESTDGDPNEPDAFLVGLAAAFDVRLTALRTNLRELDLSWSTWHNRSQAATLVGVASAVCGDHTELLVASSDPFDHLTPYGTHPLVDPRLSSSSLRVHCELVDLDRLQRVELLAGSPDALRFLQVCNRPRADWGAGTWNCGRCEKCIRTQLGLVAVGAAHDAQFAAGALTPARLDALDVPVEMRDPWRMYLEPLRARGRADLADAAASWIRRVRRRELKALVRSRLRRTRT